MHSQVWVENPTHLDDLCIEQDNVKWILKNIGLDCRNWNLKLQNRGKWQALVGIVLNLQDSYKVMNFLSDC
jgi:hypothetical protein